MAIVFLALLAAAACQSDERSGPGEQDAHRYVITSLMVTQNWTAALLDGVDTPLLLFDENFHNPTGKLSPAQEALLANARAGVLYDGHMDLFAKESMTKLLPKDAPLWLLEESESRGFNWMHLDWALQAIPGLSTRLRERFPSQEDSISANEDVLTNKLEALRVELDAQLAGLKDQEVLLEDARLRPFAEMCGLRVRATYRLHASRPATQEELETFRKEARSMSHPVVVALTGPVDAVLRDLLADEHITAASVDPIVQSAAGPDYYAVRMRQNIANLVLAMKSRETAGAP
ncbi:zinc ABC transporter substrate-binding protein [Candidatus Poribacteria bacterium]|nr:zinc ABC transporter substrate-binding protein [Candidatus Poribacteria bacterium]